MKGVAAILSSKPEEFQKLLEFMPDAMVVADSKGAILAVNSQVEKLFGYKREELLNQSIEILVPKRLREAHVRHRTQYMADPHVRPMGIGLDLHAERKDGSEVPVEISLGPVKTPGGALILAAVRDVSERRRAEEALRKARAESEILEANERTQQRIGQDLHDNLGQHLTAVTYMTRLLQKKLSAKNLAESKEAEQILKLTSEAIDQVRILARGLYPVELTTNGLLPALQELAESTRKKYGIFCFVKCEDADKVYDAETSIQFYRIAQEAVNNAVKHARPKRIVIHLGTPEGKNVLAIEDDGSGFPKSAGASKGMGLHIMRYRADLIGAAFEVGTNESGGTTVTCAVSSGKN